MHIENKRNFVLYLILFAICILTVLRLVNVFVCLAAVIVCFAFTDRKIFAEVDWLLLLTFCAFFIFVGNLGNIETVRSALSSVVKGHEFIASVLSSQIISNVPAAIMLSGFTDNARGILLGVNIGGLGTLVASLASVISYKQYMKTENAEAGRYMTVFSVVNISLLVIISAVYFLFRIM